MDFDTDYDNETYCQIYIPTSVEYRHALGGLWTSFIIIGSVTCCVLYALFFEQLVHTVNNVHARFRKYIIWIASVYPFMTLMSVVGFAVPRSQQVCNAVKIFYMTIGISNFADLTVLLYGSEQVMLWTLRDSSLKLNHGPILCCFFFLPQLAVNKVRLRTVLAGIYQLPFTQAFYLVFVIILQSANQIVIGSLDPSGSYLWLNMFSVITTLSGVYSLNILSTLSCDHLHRYYYSKLSFVMRSLILVTKFQSLIFNVMAYYEVFPCIPPISHYVYKETVENCLYIIEMLLFGVYSYKIYRRIAFHEANPSVVMPDSRGNLRPFHTAYISSLSGHIEQYGYGFPGTDFLSDVDDFNPEGFENHENGNYDFSGSTLVINDFRDPSLYRQETPVTYVNGYERLID